MTPIAFPSLPLPMDANAGDVFVTWMKSTFGSGPALGVFGPLLNNLITAILLALWMLALMGCVASLLYNAGRLGWASRHGGMVGGQGDPKQGVIISAIVLVCLVMFVSVVTALVSLAG